MKYSSYSKYHLSSKVLSLCLMLLRFLPSNGINPTQHVPAVIAFGDSIIDPGNNNVLKTIIKCNFPPYGLDFPSQTPTGRFCNGKIPTDFIASKLGVKEYLPAYLGNYLGLEDMVTGVSFASGGSGYDPLTPKIVSVLSMEDQIDLFKEYTAKLKTIAGEDRADSVISGSLYLLCSGTDDLANTYFGTPFRRKDYDIPSYVDLMITNAGTFIETLVSLGARRIGFVGLPPIGCVPSQRTLAGGITRECDETRNQAARLFNSKIPSLLQGIQTKHHGLIKLVFLDVYDIFINIIHQPNQYGFEETTKGCCGTGELEVAILCNELVPVTCPDTSKYVFWDSYHPTERGYEVLVDELFKRYLKFLI